MRAIFNRSKLLTLLQNFYTLTGIRTVLMDAEGTDILSYPEALPRFCQLIRSVPAGQNDCFLCDRNACNAVKEKKAPMIYPCHAGLTEVIAPLMVENAIVGFLLLGHIAQEPASSAPCDPVSQACGRYHIPADTLRQAYDSLPQASAEKLEAAADLLALSAQSICLQGTARLAPGSLGERLNNYLIEHLDEHITSEVLCRELTISRTALYYLSKETFGCGIMEQVIQLRINKAKHLLSSSQATSIEIAHAVGLRDENYFCRLFKQKTGITPQAYRRICQSSQLA